MIRTIKELKAAMIERKKIKYWRSAQAGYSVYTHDYNIKTANGLTRAIEDWFACSGGFAERVNVMGVPMTIRKPGIRDQIVWRKTSSTKGSADISGTLTGKTIKIEVKIGKDRQSPAQYAYQANVEMAGAAYMIVHTWEEFIIKIEPYGTAN